ncbi:hypothetical protein C0Q70_09166 [Pomacea canaliculata]|uniref:Integrin alpha-2 domain-containing protein n=2 Tax=Pomacea canaliculata TaxID=400727 RepID=A0A2T7P920_POMCA|nr:hypothetical protein C0Q70_09166 [Pomacea canaliculata]
MEGRELVTSHKVMIKQPDGTIEQCLDVSLSNSAVVMTTHSSQAPSSSPSPQTSQKSNILLPQTTGSPGSEFVPLEIEPSRRRRRQAGNEMQDIFVNSTEDRDSTLRMDCDSYMCQIFQCSLPVLPRHAQAEINISIVFNSKLLPFSSKILNILYLSDSKVAEPSTPFFHRWTEPRSKNVDTVLRQVMSSHREINIWIIIGGVIGGLAALAIITVILRRLGFFRRADKLKLQRLKRESGYYDNRRRPPLNLTEQTAVEGK